MGGKVSDFDPFAALDHQNKKADVIREMIREAINLIEADRPNAAKRHLISVLEFGPEKRLKSDG
jgi:hypothetical protein